MKEKRREYYQANREKWVGWQQDSNRRRVKQVKTYGISALEIEAMHASQGGRCAICRGFPNRKGLNIDHCHETGHVRALLCGSCNRAIGFLKDSPDLCEAAASYLRVHEQTNREQPCHATPAA